MRKSLWKKRLLSLVTVLALILIIFTYTKFTISAEIDEKEIVVTKVDIPPRTLITEDMLETIVVPSRGIPNNTLINAEEVIGQYTVAGYG
ncbi:SAF domain-containing protein, partial [Escherichia coli]|nr:SAF domain-containing protein [Escherichia coli]